MGCYQLSVRLNNQIMYSRFNFDVSNNKIISHIDTFFLNNKFENIKISKDDEAKLQNTAKEHILKSSLDFESIKNVFNQ